VKSVAPRGPDRAAKVSDWRNEPDSAAIEDEPPATSTMRVTAHR
jgi:hypothetical protein